ANVAVYRTGDVAARNLHLSSIGKALGEGAGQTLYIVAATVGLAALGFVIALRSGIRLANRANAPAVHRAAAFSGLAVVAVLVMASLFLSNGERLDHWIYGRYVEGVVAPLIVLSVLAAGRLPARTLVTTLAGGGALLLLCGALVTVVHHGATRGPIVRTNTMGVDAVFRATGFRLDVALLTAIAVGGLGIAIAYGRWGRPVAAVIVALLFLPSIVTSEQFLVDGSRSRSGERVVAETIVGLRRHDGASERCIAYDDATYSIFHFWNYRYFVPDVEMTRFDSRTGGHPCSDLVISGRPDLFVALPGARLVTWEHDAPQGLWVLPGPLQDRLAAAKRLPS